MCKFPACAFVNAGVLFYLYLTRVSVPILGTGLTQTPEISGVRSIVHVVLYLTVLYLGFIRKWRSRSIHRAATAERHGACLRGGAPL